MIKSILLIVFFISTVVCGWLFYSNQKVPDTAFVDTNYLFENSEIRKHYEQILQAKKRDAKLHLDSLYSFVVVNATDRSKMSFAEAKERFEAEHQKLEKDFLAKVYNQISNGTIRYGKAKGYDYIFGANGSGNLMYAAESHDVTKDVMVFINKEFNNE